MVNERAVNADQRGEYVLVVNDKNVVEHRTVKLGTLVDGKYVVKEGVKADDWIVVNGLQRARPGTEVKPAPEGQVAQAPKGASTAATGK
jgi:multidrug efflux pump subunit AcrA (membrane-fusion protein)